MGVVKNDFLKRIYPHKLQENYLTLNYNSPSPYLMIYPFSFLYLALFSFLPLIVTAQNQTIVCDSLISKSIELRHQKEFAKDELMLTNAIALCTDKISIYTELAILLIEKADNVYNENGKLDEKERLNSFKQALSYAKKAMAIDSTHKLALEYTAISYAGILSVSSMYQQAHLADSVRIYAEKIIFYDDTNDRAYHILGRWHYEVAQLGWFVPFMSKVFFGVAPDGSYDKAISYFLKAVQVHDYVVHNYWLGMAYLKNKDLDKAKKTFLHIQDLESTEYNDDFFKEKSRETLKIMMNDE